MKKQTNEKTTTTTHSWRFLLKNLSAGQIQAEKETVTCHIGMPVITEEDSSDTEGIMIEILRDCSLVLLIALYYAVLF